MVTHCIAFGSFFWISFINAVFCQNDPFLVPEAHGAEVTLQAIEWLQDRCIFTNDYQMLRRIAWVATKFGDNANTFDNNRGIWQVPSDILTQMVASTEPWSVELVGKLNTELIATAGKDLATIAGQADALNIPLYGAIAARYWIEQTIRAQSKTRVTASTAEQATLYNQMNPSVTTAAFSASVPSVCTSTAQADILFVMDSSKSIDNREFRQMKQFIIKLTSLLPTGRFHYALNVFATRHKHRVTFKQFARYRRNPVKKFQRRVRAPGRRGWGSNIHGALRKIKNSFSAAKGARSQADGTPIPYIVIFVSDGQSAHPDKVIAEANKVHDDYVVYSVGLGDLINEHLSREIASEKKCLHSYLAYEFPDLGSDISKELEARICKDARILELP